MTSKATQPTSRALIRAVVYGLIAGSFGANSLPHLYAALASENWITPFGSPSSPAVNAAWGTANLLVAAVTAKLGLSRKAIRAFALGSLLGAIGTAMSLMILWS